jgi:hypothetical protein
MPKCASTTLQNKVFANEIGYLGTSKTLPLTKNYGKQFEFVTPTGPRFFGSITGVNEIIKGLKNEYDPSFEGVDRFILSSELLSNRNRLTDRPIIPFLQKFKKSCWPHGEVKVLIVLRNPSERLASSYAQVSYMNTQASQSDFKNQTLRQLKSRNLLRYDKWVIELFNAFGPENVKVLFMEDIKHQRFWEELKVFCDLKKIEIKEFLKESDKGNSHRSDAKTWVLRDLQSQVKAKVFADNIFSVLWPTFLASKLRKRAYHFAYSKVEFFFEKRFGRFENKNRGSIELTPEIISRVQMAYKEQTEVLSKLLHRDLKKMGY